MELGPDVTSSDKSIKVMLNSQDKVSMTAKVNHLLQIFKHRHFQLNVLLNSRLVLKVFNEIRNEHFSNVFGFLSQKARNLQTAYDVSECLLHLQVTITTKLKATVK